MGVIGCGLGLGWIGVVENVEYVKFEFRNSKNDSLKKNKSK